MDDICEAIESHEVIMQTQRNTSLLLASFNNNYDLDLIKTGVDSSCAQSAVQWRQQYTRAYKQYDNLVYSDDTVWVKHISMESCQNGPTRHAYAWQIGPFWQDTLDL